MYVYYVNLILTHACIPANINIEEKVICKPFSGLYSNQYGIYSNLVQRIEIEKKTHSGSFGLYCFRNFVNWTGEHDRELCPSLRGIGGCNHFNVVFCVHTKMVIIWMYTYCIFGGGREQEGEKEWREKERGGGKGREVNRERREKSTCRKTLIPQVLQYQPFSEALDFLLRKVSRSSSR